MFNPNLMKDMPNDEAHDVIRRSVNHVVDNKARYAQRDFYKFQKAKNEEVEFTPEFQQQLETYLTVKAKNEVIEAENETRIKNKLKPLPKVPQTMEMPKVPFPELREGNDIWGTVEDRFFAMAKSGSTFMQRSECDNRDCRKAGEAHSEEVSNLLSLHMLGKDQTLEEHLPKFAEGGQTNNCYHCESHNRTGKVTFSGLQGATGKEWMLAFDISPGSFKGDAKTQICQKKFPRTLTTKDKQTFELAAITANYSKNHFVTAIRIPDRDTFLWYNDMHEKEDDVKFRLTDLGDFDDPLISMDNMIYLRTLTQ
jgi:hypothetical protein